MPNLKQGTTLPGSAINLRTGKSETSKRVTPPVRQLIATPGKVRQVKQLPPVRQLTYALGKTRQVEQLPPVW